MEDRNPETIIVEVGQQYLVIAPNWRISDELIEIIRLNPAGNTTTFEIIEESKTVRGGRSIGYRGDIPYDRCTAENLKLMPKEEPDDIPMPAEPVTFDCLFKE